MKYLAQTAVIVTFTALILIGYRSLGAKNMLEIKVDIGNNIVETAKKSGIPAFSTRNIAGLVSYSVDSIPENIPVTFIRPGLSASFAPIFALTMYADHENNNNLAVSDVVLQFSTDAVKDHDLGHAFVEAVNAKFSHAKRKRHISPLCPAVTGRSAYIETDGSVKIIGACPLDPAYKVAATEWRLLAKAGITYEWIADGVIATLRVDASEDSRGITYTVFLEYADVAIKAKHDEKNLAEKLADGDRQGWNSSASYNADIIHLKEKVKVLEANAVKRGDSLVPRVRSPLNNSFD